MSLNSVWFLDVETPLGAAIGEQCAIEIHHPRSLGCALTYSDTSRSAKMRMEKKYGAVNFSEWFSKDPLRHIAAKEVQSSVAEAFDEDPPWALLPFIWGDNDGYAGPGVVDPLCVYVTLSALDASDSEFQPLIYSFSVADILAEFVSDLLSGDTKKIEQEDEICLARKLADELRRQAALIEAAIGGK